MKVNRFIEVAPTNSKYTVTYGTPNTKTIIHTITKNLTKIRYIPNPEKKEKEFFH